MTTSDTSKKAHLIVADDPNPAIKVKPGMRFEVHALTVVDAALDSSDKVAARLCGGTSTCIALVEV